MMIRSLTRCTASAGWLLLVLSLPQSVAEEQVDYGRQVRPLLSGRCFHCHGLDESTRQADLRLDQRDSALAVIQPGDADASELLHRISATDTDTVMPPPESGESLQPDEIALVKKWIDQGAVYEEHWAFEKLVRPPAEWSIDRLVRDRLQAAGLDRNPPASRETLLRRVSLDLRGMPPTVEELAEFLADDRPDAYERMVDRLLESPHTAERLAIDWLDAARYADTNGFSIDEGRFMWAWRDWVIKAYADNMPYDQFLTKQLAGDLLPDADDQDLLATGFLRCSMNTHEGGTLPEEYRVISMADKVDATATVFLGLTMRCAQCHDHKYDPISQQDYFRFYALFNTTSEPGHGATNGNTEPTALVAPPLPVLWQQVLEGRMEDLRAALRQPYPALASARDAWEAKQREQMTSLVSTPAGDDDAEPLRVALATDPRERSDADWQAINEAFAKESVAMQDLLKSTAAEQEAEQRQFDGGQVSAMVMDHDPQRKTHLLVRGQYDQLGEVVEPGVPAALGPAAEVRDRLELARWLTDPDHPLTARVAVNRYWQFLFGVGLVATSEDFGVRAEYPSHPELLDRLAIDFVQHGWDVRRLLRQMLLSETYRQSAVASPRALEIDPENRLFSRSRCQRLPAEVIRDNALAVGGLLETRLGGPPVLPPQPDGLWREVSHYGHPSIIFTAQSYYPSQGGRQYRRSLYTYWKRSSPPPTMTTFDAPTREVCVTRRGMTTTPLQALVLWNEPQFVAAARGLARRALTIGGDDAARLNAMFRIALSREPDEQEREQLLTQLDHNRQHFADKPDAARQLAAGSQANEPMDELAAWTMVASTLINLHEFNSRP